MAAPISPDSPLPEVVREMARIFWRDAVTPHWGAALGACLALYVFSRQLSERRPPGNIMAWGMLMLIAPVPGLILFMLFGARKRAEMGRIRLAVAHAAGLLRENEANPAGGPDPAPTPGNRVTLLADTAGTATFLALRDQIARAT